MKRRTSIAVAAVAGLAAAGTATGVATASDDDNETAITGSALDRAERAALDEVGEGRVTATEAGDEEGAYEVEVTRGDGTQVDVHLDQDFQVLSTEADGAEDTEGAEGDEPAE